MKAKLDLAQSTGHTVLELVKLASRWVGVIVQTTVKFYESIH